MTPSQLRTFLAVADASSVRGAAEALVVSQPAVSSVLAALRRELGVDLVERDGRGLAVTAAGRVLAGYAREILGLIDEAGLATRARADPTRGVLRIAAVTTAGEHVIPELLAQFRARYPDVEVILEVGNRRRVEELLGSRGVDLALGGRPPVGGRFATLALRPHELVVVAPSRRGGLLRETGASRKLRTSGETEARDTFSSYSLEKELVELADATWLVREKGSGTRETADELLGELAIAPGLLTIGSNEAIVESVRAGLGIALLSRDAVRRALCAGELVEWRHGPLPLQRKWHFVARSSAELPETAKLFLAAVTSEDVAGAAAFVGGAPRERSSMPAPSGRRAPSGLGSGERGTRRLALEDDVDHRPPARS